MCACACVFMCSRWQARSTCLLDSAAHSCVMRLARNAFCIGICWPHHQAHTTVRGLALFARLTCRFQASGEAWGASVSLLESESLEVQAFAASVLLQKCRNEGASIAPQARDEIGAAVLARAEVNLDQSSLPFLSFPLAPLCGRSFCGFCSCCCSCCSNAFSSGGLPDCIVAFILWHFALVTARALACLHRQQRRA